MKLSNHTQQMNIWIALCKKDPTFPHPLCDLKYSPEIIDPNFILKGRSTNPDLILTSKKNNHSIVVDCKSKTLKEKQLKKYEELRKNSEVLYAHGIVDIVHPEHYHIDITISSFFDISRLLKTKIINCSFVRFVKDENNRIKEIKTHDDCDFDLEKLKKCFPIKNDKGFLIPTDYFPFDTLDNDLEQFIISIFQSLIEMATNGKKEFTNEELLEECHPFWNIMGTTKKKEFRNELKKFMAFYFKDLTGYIDRIADSKNYEWRVIAPSFQAFQNKCEEIIKKAKDDFKQSSLNV